MANQLSEEEMALAIRDGWVVIRNTNYGSGKPRVVHGFPETIMGVAVYDDPVDQEVVDAIKEAMRSHVDDPGVRSSPPCFDDSQRVLGAHNVKVTCPDATLNGSEIDVYWRLREMVGVSV